MKKWIMAIVCLIVVAFLYINGEYEAQKCRIEVIHMNMNTNNKMFKDGNCDNSTYITDSLKDIEKLGDAYNKLSYYNQLKKCIEFIICLTIFLITLCVWSKWRNENPNNPPKLFWTLIFGWIYLLYYWCNKKGI